MTDSLLRAWEWLSSSPLRAGLPFGLAAALIVTGSPVPVAVPMLLVLATLVLEVAWVVERVTGRSATWQCSRCGARAAGNPKQCDECGYTVYDRA